MIIHTITRRNSFDKKHTWS